MQFRGWETGKGVFSGLSDNICCFSFRMAERFLETSNIC